MAREGGGSIFEVGLFSRDYSKVDNMYPVADLGNEEGGIQSMARKACRKFWEGLHPLLVATPILVT